MLLYSIRRLLASFLVLLASSFLVFVLVAQTVDPLAQYRTRQPPPPPQFFEQKRDELGLDQPILGPLLALVDRRFARRLRATTSTAARSARPASSGWASPPGW